MRKYTNFKKNTQETYKWLTKYIKKYTNSQTFTKETYKCLTKCMKNYTKSWNINSLKIIYIHMKTWTSHEKPYKNYLHSKKEFNNTCKILIIQQKSNINTDMYTQNE